MLAERKIAQSRRQHSSRHFGNVSLVEGWGGGGEGSLPPNQRQEEGERGNRKLQKHLGRGVQQTNDYGEAGR